MASKNNIADEKKLKKLILVTFIIMVALGIDGQVKKHREKEKQNQEKARMELRSRQFAEYIIKDVEKQVGKKLDKQAILWYVDEYEKNPKKYDERIKDLMADSTRYADAIFRDASVIHEYDKRAGKTLAFEEAMKMVEAEEALTTGPNEATGGREVKGANPRRKLKVNKGYLKDSSKMLREYRVAKSMAK